VEYERRIRLFALQDINQLLQAEGVEMQDLLGDIRQCDGKGDDEGLAFWFFDDDNFECRTWQEWLSLGTNQTYNHEVTELGLEQISVPAFVCQSFSAGGVNEVKYVKGSVVGYDQEVEMFKVTIAGDPEHRVLRRPRLLVMFQADDPFMFAKRIGAALREREKVTRELAYNLCLDCMPVDFLPAMTHKQTQHIVAKAVTTKRLISEHATALQGSLSSSPAMAAIVEEMNLEYLRALNKCILDDAYKANQHLPAQEQNASLSAALCPQSSWGPMRSGCVAMPPGYDFVELRNQFTFRSFLTVKDVLRCISNVQLQSTNIAGSSLFAVTSHTVRPDEFEQMQQSHREKMTAMLKEQWVSSMCLAITKSLESIGKGWFNTREHRMNVYLESKLRKLMMQVKFIMQDCIRTLCDSSTQHFVDLVVSGLDFDVEIESFDKVTNTRRPPPDTPPMAAPGSRRWQAELARIAKDNALGGGASARRAGGLFLIDIVSTPQTNVLAPTYGVQGIETMPLEIYDAGVATMQGIPELEPLILTSMFWPEKPELAAPDEQDPKVAARRQRIAAALKAATKPVEAYLASLKPIQDIVDIDVPAVIKEWEVKKPEEIAAGLKSFQAKKDSMEGRIPRQVAVGGFMIGMERVKKLVLGKYTEIIDGLGGAIALATRKRSEAAIKRYDSILATLKRQPASIEAIGQTREYIAELPDVLKELKEEVDSVSRDYDLLDGLFYAYTNPDVKQRWHCYGLPHEIHGRIATALVFLDDKQAEFEKAMKDEQEEFNEEIATLARMVASYKSRKVDWVVGMGEEGDLVEETTAEVKRIQKRLAETDQLVKKFNSREILFGVPQTDYSDVGRTAKVFEPYAAMWLAINDFGKKRDIWMTDPFTSLDAEYIEKSIQGWWRTIFKASKTFEASQPELLPMAMAVKTDIEAFKTNLPIITALRNAGMRDRHWKALSAEIGMDLSFSENVTLDSILNEMKLPDFMDQISKTGDLASKEHMIERTLLEMKGSWEGVDLDLMPYR
jgi:dynein heavy chain